METPCSFDLPTVWRGRKQAVASPKIRKHYEKHVGAIRVGWHIHHLCGDPACSNPEHLRAVSPPAHVVEDRYRRLGSGFNETLS